jgi:Uma2 family endonuclease
MKSAAQTERAESLFDGDVLYRLSVKQYHQMAKAGILLDGAPVELLEGLLFIKHPPAGATEEDELYRLSVKQYQHMIRLGILEEDTPVELLEGLLVQKMTKNPPHRVACGLTRRALEALLSGGYFLDVQEPVSTRDSQPEPDLAVIRGELRQYAKKHPGPKDAALIIEVADTSLPRDRTRKKRIYARARVPVYWIVNLIDRQVEVYTDPSGRSATSDYRQHQDYGPDAAVPVVIDGREVGQLTVRDLLP